MMNKWKIKNQLCAYEFRLHWSSKRVWMGYLTGMAVMLWQTSGVIRYAESTGEVYQAMEPFIVAMNKTDTVLFAVLGWLLIISDAPFIRDNALYILHRTEKRIWNGAILRYLVGQGILYYLVLAFSGMGMGYRGYLANSWSWPVQQLAKSSFIGADFGIQFDAPLYIQKISVYQALGITLGLSLLYGLMLAFFLYAFSLLADQMAGMVAVFAFHFLGYEIMKEGFMLNVRWSLMARSISILQIGADTDISLTETICIYIAVLWFLSALSYGLIRYTDVREAARGESW